VICWCISFLFKKIFFLVIFFSLRDCFFILRYYAFLFFFLLEGNSFSISFFLFSIIRVFSSFYIYVLDFWGFWLLTNIVIFRCYIHQLVSESNNSFLMCTIESPWLEVIDNLYKCPITFTRVWFKSVRDPWLLVGYVIYWIYKYFYLFYFFLKTKGPRMIYNILIFIFS